MAPEKLLGLIESHLKRSKEKAYIFGLRAAGDQALVNKLRGGRQVRFDLEKKILAAIPAARKAAVKKKRR